MNSTFYIQGMGWDARSGNDGAIVTPWWIVKRFREGLSPLAVRFADLTSNYNRVDFGYLPAVAVENVPNRVWSFWFNTDVVTQEGDFISTFTGTTSTDIQGYKIHFRSLDRKIQFIGVSGSTVQFWRSAALANTPNTWIHILLSYDAVSTLNQPLLFVNGVSNAFTFNSSQSTSMTGEIGTNLRINSTTDSLQLSTFKDVRIYNGDKSGDVATLAALLYAEGAYGDDNKDGLLFRTFYAPSLELANYEGEYLTEDMKLVDDIGFAIGTPTNEPLGEAV